MRTSKKRYRLCARGEGCVAYPQLGQPAKLSKSNTASVCFACRDKALDQKLEAAQTPKAKPRRKDLVPYNRPRDSPWAQLFIHRTAEKAHSRKLVVASPSTNIRHIANRAVSPWDPAAFCRGIATPAARICYKELQVVAAELRENYSCVALCVLRGR